MGKEVVEGAPFSRTRFCGKGAKTNMVAVDYYPGQPKVASLVVQLVSINVVDVDLPSATLEGYSRNPEATIRCSPKYICFSAR